MCPFFPPFMILAFSKHFFFYVTSRFWSASNSFRRSLCVQRWGQGWCRQEQACSVLTNCGKLVHFEERCSVWPLLPCQVIGVLLCGSVLPTRPQRGGSLVLRVWFWGPKVACVWSCLLTWSWERTTPWGILWGAQELDLTKGRVPQGTPPLATSPSPLSEGTSLVFHWDRYLRWTSYAFD